MKNIKNPEENRDYWVRWEYSEEEWWQFDRVDWGRTVRRFILFILLWVLVAAGFFGGIGILNASGQTNGTTGAAVVLPVIILIAFFMIILLIVFSVLWGRPVLMSWRRHRAANGAAQGNNWQPGMGKSIYVGGRAVYSPARVLHSSCLCKNYSPISGPVATTEKLPESKLVPG